MAKSRHFKINTMALNIVIASDSFKGSLSSAEVAEAAKAGILSVLPMAQVSGVAVADGGEGTADTLVRALGGRWIDCRVADPLGRMITARYGIVDTPDGPAALIDMASASGLPLLLKEERDVMHTTTRGTGDMIADAYRRECRKFVIGIGGSATCDGGMGMLQALGFRFLDADGHELPSGGGALQRLERIDDSEAMRDLTDCRFTIICDVTNPLCGPDGSAAVFGPQKGASSADVAELDRGLAHYATIVARDIGRDVAQTPGSGAAGGLGAAFLAFFNSELRPGVEAVLDLVGFDTIIKDADLVITGEGRIDAQTLFGKLPLGVGRRAAAAGVPVVAIAGMVEDASVLLKGGFAGVFPILSRVASLEEAMSAPVARANVAAVAASIANFFNVTHAHK